MNSVSRSAVFICGVCLILGMALVAGWWLGKALPSERSWMLDDLRALDSSDTLAPASDLTAVYTRPAGSRCEIRLDFLDLPIRPEYHLRLVLEKRQIELSSNSTLPDDISITYDPLIEAITLSLGQCPSTIPAPLTIQSFSPGSTAPADEISLYYGGWPLNTEIRARVQFAFYNTFDPVAIPIQALRRWDGAHSGPRGERHGLKYLLNAAEQYQIPLTLLDLKAPANLSALETTGGMAQIRRMEQNGLLELPLVLMGEPMDVSLALSRSAAGKFNLYPGYSLHNAFSPYPLPLFRFTDNPADGYLIGQFQWLPSDAETTIPPLLVATVNPDDNGLPLNVRRALLTSALLPRLPNGPLRIQNDQPIRLDTVLLGGDFQKTTWGTPEYVNPAFAYLSARPYIQFVHILELSSANTHDPELQLNPIAQSAAEMRFALNSPTSDQKLTALRQNYAGLVDQLSAAAEWAEAPTAHAECKDLCILASDEFYAVLDSRGGTLVFFFAGSEQVIGPSAQFFVGLSDQSLWDLSKGWGADPAQVMGAFADADEPFRLYQPVVLDSKTIRLIAFNGQVKTYRLTASGLEVQLSGPIETKIPLTLSPQSRFETGWAGRYQLQQGADWLLWGLAFGPQVRIQAMGGGVLTGISFLDALPLLVSPENPNSEVPAGAYLPFPLAIGRFSSPGAANISITVKR